MNGFANILMLMCAFPWLGSGCVLQSSETRCESTCFGARGRLGIGKR
jgi:hypothetical protein